MTTATDCTNLTRTTELLKLELMSGSRMGTCRSGTEIMAAMAKGKMRDHLKSEWITHQRSCTYSRGEKTFTDIFMDQALGLSNTTMGRTTRENRADDTTTSNRTGGRGIDIPSTITELTGTATNGIWSIE